MQSQHGEPQNLRTLLLERVIDGVTVTASVSPCAWMYPGHPLQVKFTLPDGDEATLRPREIPFDSATASDVRTLLDRVRLCKCVKCGNPTFDPETVSTRPSRDCRACVKAETDAHFRSTQQLAERGMARANAEKKAEGFTHRIDGWIHPDDGDDRALTLWMRNPTTELIFAELRRCGSEVSSDYRVVAL
ncbi:hypothetical protein [Paraburkholderia youngii]|uniref:hypothetical protein n=1 Tax=Paraburkholderia youngii TaxID=2782701 RepID=UPI003D20F51F